ncbi:hypothetical protein Tco_0304971 [Tanacetum coccineum]
MVIMVKRNHGEHLIRRFVERGNEPETRDVKIASLKQRIQELEFSQLQQDSPIKEAKTESNISDNGSEDVNPFGGGNPGFHDESEPIIWDIGDEEEEYPFVNKYLNVIDEEEGFVGKGGISREEDNIEDVVVVANDLCYSIIQTILSVDFEEDINTKSHELMSFEKVFLSRLMRLAKKFRGTIKASESFIGKLVKTMREEASCDRTSGGEQFVTEEIIEDGSRWPNIKTTRSHFASKRRGLRCGGEGHVRFGEEDRRDTHCSYAMKGRMGIIGCGALGDEDAVMRVLIAVYIHRLVVDLGG